MTFHDHTIPSFAAFQQMELANHRALIEQSVEYLIELLDQLDTGSEDMEPDVDIEFEQGR